MKSRMSCFNGAVLKRTLFRGLPLWGAYLLCWIVAMPVVILSNGNYQEIVYLKDYVLEVAAGSCNVVNFVYGLAVTCMVSSYLYKSRSANFFGALPLRRETMFLTQYAGGLLFAVVPNLIISLLTLFAGLYWGGNMMLECAIWFAAQFLAFLFYYSFAQFVSMIVGNLLALPLIYGVLNFTAVVVEAIVRQLLDVFVHGAWFRNDFLFDWASPLYYVLASNNGPRVRNNYVADVFTSSTFYNWDLLLIYAAVGVGFALAAFFIHKYRRMESAGDVIAVRHLKPVFLYGFTVGCGLCIGYFLAAIILQGVGRDNFVPVLICMLVGAFIGYFVGQMLLHRSVRVFRSRYFANYGVVAVIILAVMLCVRFDVFGYSRFVPDAEDVYGVDIGYTYDRDEISTDPALIQKTVDTHKVMMAEDETEGPWGWRTAYISYHMKDGRVVRRSYDLPVSEALSQNENSAIRMYEALHNDPDYIVIRELGANYTAADIEVCNIYNHDGADVYLNGTEAYQFLKTCVEPDLRESTMGIEEYSGRDLRAESVEMYITVEFKEPTAKDGIARVAEYIHLGVTKDAHRILAFAAEKGIKPNS